MSSTKKTNKRACSRTPLELEVTLVFDKGSTVYGRLLDISFGGALVQTNNNSLFLGLPLTIVLNKQDSEEWKSYSMSAVVVRETPEGAGVMFNEYDADTIHCMRHVYKHALA